MAESDVYIGGVGSYDHAWYTEHNHTTFVTISQILMKWAKYCIRKNNIWHTLLALVTIPYITDTDQTPSSTRPLLDCPLLAPRSFRPLASFADSIFINNGRFGPSLVVTIGPCIPHNLLINLHTFSKSSKYSVFFSHVIIHHFSFCFLFCFVGF